MNLTTLLLTACIVLVPSAALPKADTSPVITEAIVNAPPEVVWKAWTTKEGIESWMVAKTQIELKVGALWKTSYNKDSTLDDDASIHQLILSVDPGHMLSFRTVKAPKGFPYAEPIARTWVVAYLDPAGTGKTKVTLKMFGFTEDELSQDMRSKFIAGNKFTMDKLVEKFAKG